MVGLSQFIEIQSRGEKAVLFDVLKGEIAFTSVRYFKSLEKGMISELPARLRLSMLKNGMIASDSGSERNSIYREYVKQKTSGSVLCFTITPTYSCNCNCRTCFQKDYNKDLKMTDDVCHSIISLVQNLMKEKRSSAVVLWLYGGEPFVYAQQSIRMVDGIKRICQKAGKVCYTYATTNGTLLSLGRSKKLTSLVDHFYISLSQSELAQAKERPYKNGKNSYQAVLKSCKYLGRQEKQMTMRINVSNLDTLETDIPSTLNDLLVAFGGKPYDKICFEFSPLNEKVQHCLIDKETSRKNSERENSLNSLIRRLISSMTLPWDIRHFKLPVAHDPISYHAGACGFELCGYLKGNSFFIAPEGNLYMCNITENDPAYLLGNVLEYTTALNNEFYRKVLDFDLFTDDSCKSCRYLPLCLRDCPLQIIRNGGRLRREGCKQSKQKMVHKQIDYLWEKWQREGFKN